MPSLNILPYTGEAFRKFYGDEFISGFTHTFLATGQIDREESLKIVEELNRKRRDKMQCISFNQAMLNGNQLEGGACSAIAFRVAKEALNLLKNVKANSQLKPFSKELGFALRFSRFIHYLEETATSKRSAEKVIQTTIRSEQAAFNTITVDRKTVHAGNAVNEKISAMASFYGLKVVESSPEIRARGNEELQAQLQKQLSSLKEGVYFLRIIQEKNNHKLEEKGHSIIYIKTPEAEYNFDSSLGVYTFFADSTKPNFIFNSLLSANQRFGVDVLSFHKLEEESPISSNIFHVSDLNLKGIIYSPSSKIENVPLVIFSPGLGVSVDNYKAMAELLCAKGFLVMCVDHPGTCVGSPRLEEPAIIECAIQNGINIQRLVELVRKGYFAGIPSKVQIAVIGHSIGGSASIEACRRTLDIKAAINLDGRIINPTQILQPVLQVIAKHIKEDRSQYNAALETLSNINPLFSQVEFEIKHGDFSSPNPDLLKRMAEQCADFLTKHLTIEEEK